MARPNEKDVETMPTQKVFKRRVRARMTKTGESYTAARRQLLNKAGEVVPNAAAAPAPEPPAIPSDAQLVADEAMIRATGKGHAEWFALLDAWGATDHNHTVIARWLREAHGVPGWWAQNVTVAYERARGRRQPGQMADGFSVSVTRTIAVDPERALEAFTNDEFRVRWLPDAPLTPRPTRAARTARFDWADPVSRVVVNIAPKDHGKSIVAVAHERIADAAAADRLKASWRSWLGDLKVVLERG
ncbi:MAG TPA: hypothetical protein VFO73_07635 [Candidatus Limnocylindrales bacterium]|nr:hypothetical protein [Candidatus Limnocylindrales bacterium]